MTEQRPAAAAEPPEEGLGPPVGDPFHGAASPSGELAGAAGAVVAGPCANVPAAAALTSDDTAYGRRLDEVVPASWTPGMAAALDLWQQGDLLRGAPLFWLSPAGDDPVMATTGPEGDATGEPLPFPHDDGTEADGWLAITSQTCDIAVTGPGARHPAVTASPVYRLPDDIDSNRRTAILNCDVTWLFPLTDPPGGGLYVADLRWSMPVSKGVLLAQTPTRRSGWADEPDLLDFAEAIARKARRPALHDVISDDMVDSLNTYIRGTRKSFPEWHEHVQQVRLRLNGERLRPTSVSLVICCDVELTAEEKATWRGWQRQGKKLLATAGIGLGPPLIRTLEQLPARIYQDSVPLKLPALGPPPPG
jgi:hypothetical protein